ncbi:unnamed protein product [Tuber melanosporum]|uniref:(Perigord truffle) hypothetical protein n=1 Tax=Tuber melanosporum (strain Mel28) TaxID=656061 RepID=D5GC73_TUBMM|nr:uncharacterized protein GSTUM_00000612001 [Tuber melanosporum]CAZ82116.1 unnamed protein product [Tuber melanosporum]
MKSDLILAFFLLFFLLLLLCVAMGERGVWNQLFSPLLDTT